MFGRVTNYFEDRGFGFIFGENNQKYYVHRSKLKGEHIERGYLVFFKIYSTDRGDNNAKDITVIESDEKDKKNGKKNK